MANSKNPVLSQLLLLDLVVRAKAFKQGMEFRAMVRVAQMAELVEKDIVPQILRHSHKVKVEIDVPFSGATAPVGDVVFDPDLVIFK